MQTVNKYESTQNCCGEETVATASTDRANATVFINAFSFKALKNIQNIYYKINLI